MTVTLEESGCVFEKAKLCDASFRQSYTPFTKVPPRGFMFSQASDAMSSRAPNVIADINAADPIRKFFREMFILLSSVAAHDNMSAVI